MPARPARPPRTGPCLRRLGAALLGGLCLALPVAAQLPATDSQAMLLQALLQRRIERLAELAAPALRVRLIGRVEGEAAGSLYRFELPGAEIVLPGGESAVLKPSRLQLSQLDEDVYRIDRLTLPPEIPWFDAGGERGGALTLGGQRFTATWSLSLGGFRSLDAAWTDVRLTGLPIGPVTADSLMLRRKLEDAPGDRLDRRSDLQAANLRVGDATGSFQLMAGDLTAALELGAFSPESWQRLIGPALSRDPAADLRALFDSVSLAVAARHLTLLLPPLRAKLVAEEGRADLELDGWGGTGAIRGGIGYSDLRIDAPDPLLVMVPTHMRLSSSLAPVPWAALVADALAGVAVPAPVRLAEAGSELRLQGGATVAGAALTVDGRLDAVVTNRFGFAGTVIVLTRQLGRVVDALALAPQTPRTQAAQLVVAVFRALGRGDRDEEGRFVRRYDLTLTPDGQTLLNGRSADAALSEAFPGRADPRGDE